jgi:hypothetical protein
MHASEQHHVESLISSCLDWPLLSGATTKMQLIRALQSLTSAAKMFSLMNPIRQNEVASDEENMEAR